jgi:predicted dehydrogenase
LKLRAAVIGLGRIGSRFDEEPGRAVVWSHVGAYLACADEFSLVGAAEPDAGNAAAFRARCPTVSLFDTTESLLTECAPEVISICTPAEHHRKALDLALSCSSVRLVWCEKPLAAHLDDAVDMVAAATKADVRLVVSQVRRWLPIWQRVAALIASGAIGAVTVVRVAMPNRVVSIGSHALDLAVFLGGRPVRITALPLAALAEENEPAIAALINFASGAYGIVQVTGLKGDLIVEAEIIGREGRLMVEEASGRIALQRFEKSPLYENYRALGPAAVERAASFAETSPFIAIARELAELARAPARQPSCSGADALQVQRMLAILLDLAAHPDEIGVQI